jgi:hypothetical protein
MVRLPTTERWRPAETRAFKFPDYFRRRFPWAKQSYLIFCGSVLKPYSVLAGLFDFRRVLFARDFFKAFFHAPDIGVIVFKCSELIYDVL